MKAIFALLLVASCALSVFGQVRTSDAPFTVTISVETPVVKAGKQVIVDVTVTNTSKHKIDGSGFHNKTLGLDTYDTYDIRDSVGNPVEKNTIKHPESVVGGEIYPSLSNPAKARKSAPMYSASYTT